MYLSLYIPYPVFVSSAKPASRGFLPVFLTMVRAGLGGPVGRIVGVEPRQSGRTRRVFARWAAGRVFHAKGKGTVNEDACGHVVGAGIVHGGGT